MPFSLVVMSVQDPESPFFFDIHSRPPTSFCGKIGAGENGEGKKRGIAEDGRGVQCEGPLEGLEDPHPDAGEKRKYCLRIFIGLDEFHLVHVSCVGRLGNKCCEMSSLP